MKISLCFSIIVLQLRGSNGVQETCDNISSYTGHPPPALFTYTTEYGVNFPIPNQNYIDSEYQARFVRIDPALAATLYGSSCLEALNGTDTVNDNTYPAFEYADELLYEIGIDKVEACSVNNDTKKDELRQIAIDKAPDYNVPIETSDVSLLSFRAQMESYDCNFTFTKPWNHLDSANINAIWNNFIDEYKICTGQTP